MNPGLEFDTFGMGITHMAEEGEPPGPCIICHGHGQVVVTMHDVEIDTLPCPRGCAVVHDG